MLILSVKISQVLILRKKKKVELIDNKLTISYF